MLARIAQELFWLGRDMTRAEHTARMLDGAFHADVPGTPGERGVTLSWNGVLAVIGAKPPAPGGEAALATGPYSVYQEVKERCALFWGLLVKTMLRDEARSFLDAGGRIEEADMVLRMLRVAIPVGDTAGALDEPAQAHEAEAIALLHAVGGVQAFRRHVRSGPSLNSVGSFLLYESAYPGSVLASLDELRDALETADQTPRSAPPVLRLGRLIADLELQQRTVDRPEPLVEMLARVQAELEQIDHEIDDRYFAVAALSMVHV